MFENIRASTELFHLNKTSQIDRHRYWKELQNGTFFRLHKAKWYGSLLKCLSQLQAGIKRDIQKFKTNVENVNFYFRDFKLGQLFKIFLRIVMQLNL